MPTVIIIGSGYFGILSANTLVSKTSYEVKMVSPSDHTYFLVSSIRVPVYNDPEDIKGTMLPLGDVLYDRVEVVKGIAESFDMEKVVVDGVEHRFDALIIATGAKWEDPIGSTFQFGKSHLEYFTEQHDKMGKAKHIVLIGGGFNNAELGGELIDRYGEACLKGEKKLTMVHSQPILMPDNGLYCEPLRREVTNFFLESPMDLILGQRAKVEGTRVLLPDGTIIEADHIIRSTGVEPLVPSNNIKGLVDSQGFVIVEDSFQCSATKGNIFAVGDVNDIKYKGLAIRNKWTNTLVHNVDVVLSGKGEIRRVDKNPGYISTLVSLGKYRGTGQFPTWFGTFTWPNWMVSWAKSRTLHMGKTHVYRPS